jgi:hypothetical protein
MIRGCIRALFPDRTVERIETHAVIVNCASGLMKINAAAASLSYVDCSET